jgi:hypothetical protein
MLKIDLTLLKKLIAELESELKASETIPTDSSLNLSEASLEPLEHDRLIHLGKAAGLCMSVAQEGTLLMYDIQKVSAGALVAPKSSTKEDADFGLSNFLKIYKSGGQN